MSDQRLVPHFSVTTIDGDTCRYADLWQRKNLLLVLIPRTESAHRDAYIAKLREHTPDLDAHHSSCVITSDEVAGVRAPAVVIADRWGEIVFQAEGDSVAALPGPESIIEWLRYVQNRCPECEGEAR
jgi:hypothetical protein